MCQPFLLKAIIFAQTIFELTALNLALSSLLASENSKNNRYLQ